MAAISICPILWNIAPKIDINIKLSDLFGFLKSKLIINILKKPPVMLIKKAVNPLVDRTNIDLIKQIINALDKLNFSKTIILIIFESPGLAPGSMKGMGGIKDSK